MGNKVNNYLARYNKVVDNNTVLLIDKMTDDFKAFNERTQAAVEDGKIVNKPPPDFFTICANGYVNPNSP